MSEATSEIQQMLESTIHSMEILQNLFNGDEQHPYKTLDDAIVSLESHCGTLSHKTSILVGEIKTLTETAKSNYCFSVKKIDAWCGKASDLLTAYINLCNESFFTKLLHTIWRPEEAVKTQRDLLMKVLSDGMQEMSTALKAFEKSVGSFDQASGKLIELESALGHDKNKNIWKNLKEGFGGVENKIFIVINGMIAVRSGLSIAVMAVTAIGSTAQVTVRIYRLHKQFKTLAENVRNSKAEIDHVKKMCIDEMDIIEELKAMTDTANFLLSKRLLQERAIFAVKKLITLCENYREKNREKNSNYFNARTIEQASP